MSADRADRAGGGSVGGRGMLSSTGMWYIATHRGSVKLDRKTVVSTADACCASASASAAEAMADA